MSAQLGQLAVVHWALIASNNAHALDRMYNELHVADIHNVIQELREIQSHLNDLELWFQDQRINRLMPREMRDMITGISACSISLGKLDETVKSITTLRRGEPTSRIWGEIRAKFKDMEGPICERFHAHRVWLTQLFPILKMHFIFSKPQNRMELDSLRNQIRYVQPPSPQYSPTGFVPLVPWTNQPNPNPPHPGPPAVYTGPTGPGGFYPSPPNSNSSNNSPQTARPGFTLYYPTQPQIAAGPATLPLSGPSSPIDYEPPRARPLSRSASRGASRSASRPSHRRQHSEGYEDRRWSREERRPRSEDGETWSEADEPKSQWFGRAIDAYNISTAENEQEIIMAEFYPDMTVYLYRNEQTNASRIVCKFTGVGNWINDQKGGGRPKQGSIKVNALTISREDPYILKLRRNKHLWASLVFTDFENMVIFWNVFIALRTFSPSEYPIPIVSEIWMRNEKSLWHATIEYEQEHYKLHLLRDEDTQAVRIAAIESGPGRMNNMTIWTAFLHTLMERHGRFYRRESCTVILERTVFHFFSTVYRIKMMEFPLQFLNSQDAIDFCEEVEDLTHDRLSSRS